MDEFYRLSKTKPLSKEELEKVFSDARVLCECNTFRISGAKKFHSIKELTIQEWQALHDKYPDEQVYVCNSFCYVSPGLLIERNDIYSLWKGVR